MEHLSLLRRKDELGFVFNLHMEVTGLYYDGDTLNAVLHFVRLREKAPMTGTSLEVDDSAPGVVTGFGAKLGSWTEFHRRLLTIKESESC
ncbi:hypothetical protein AVEN_262631-1 [Araneus ventricosus]|uniref:Uncharacterized protein n=1 Tax=Araneus ventricosus TaxID=182803 RepID=A0A4Y2NXZ1_ARAVE|nr:hypothetical protein AVEN_262631-1 [Araneus ventricosus]